MTQSPPRRPASIRLLLPALACLGVCLGVRRAEAGVVVIGNHTAIAVDFVVTPAGGAPEARTLAPKHVLPLHVAREVELSFDAAGAKRRLRLDVDSAHFFTREEGSLKLHRIGSAGPSGEPRGSPAGSPGGSSGRPPNGAPAESSEGAAGRSSDVASADPGPPSPRARLGGLADFYRMGIVPVMILVDDEQQLVARSIWERQFRERLEKASDVFERHCRVRFRPVQVGTWDSEDGVLEFDDAIREFQREVVPDPAPLAIGFTSQKYYLRKRRQWQLGAALGGPLRRHVLIRESTRRLTERERREVLIHELGHFLGAVHCPYAYSVMRPKLGDRQALERSFRIGFDPANTLVMCLVASELRTGTVGRFGQLSDHTKQRLRAVYEEMAASLPDDESLAHGIALLDGAAPNRPAPLKLPASTVTAARAVVEAIREAAEASRRRPDGSSEQADAGRLTGDELTAHYFRRAAAAAGSARPESAADGYLLGLAIGLDHSPVLRDDPLTGPLTREVESQEARRRRLAVLGRPTMRGRYDVTRHFTLGCGLTVLLGPEAAEQAGRMREWMDSRRGDGFSFVHLAAHLSGAAFAERLRSGTLELSTLAESFRVEDHLPSLHDLDEGLTGKAFLLRYGSLQDERFHRRIDAIRARIRALREGWQPQEATVE